MDKYSRFVPLMLKGYCCELVMSFRWEPKDAVSLRNAVTSLPDLQGTVNAPPSYTTAFLNIGFYVK